jgi:Bacterial SH3 domain
MLATAHYTDFILSNANFAKAIYNYSKRAKNIRETINMKRCPQCNSVFAVSLVYCTNDGTPLREETFVLPSEASRTDAEEETIIHHDPLNINISSAPAPTEVFNYQVPPPPINIAPVVIEKPRSSWKNLLFLLIGLILGGGLVLGAVVLGLFLYQSKYAPTTTANRNSQTNAPQTLKPTATPLTASAKHEKRTAASDDEFNGRVITLNAFVRSSANRGSKEIDILPIDDRLNIEERENENSPWYRVTCEHGTSGWMHGNTIEYTR